MRIMSVVFGILSALILAVELLFFFENTSYGLGNAKDIPFFAQNVSQLIIKQDVLNSIHIIIDLNIDTPWLCGVCSQFRSL